MQMRLFDVPVGSRFVFHGIIFKKISNCPVKLPDNTNSPNVVIVDVTFNKYLYQDKIGHRCCVSSLAKVELIK